MSKFKVGDRVRSLAKIYLADFKGVGTVVSIYRDDLYDVVFDDDTEQYEYSHYEHELELVSEVETSSGNSEAPESSQKPSEPEQEVSQEEVDKMGEKAVESVRSHNVGDSDYSTRTIQPWDIWLEYELNPWDADIIKRVLRNKASQSRKMDYEKIIHVCQERIRQIEEQE